MSKLGWKILGLALVLGLGAWILLDWYVNKPARVKPSSPKEMYETSLKLAQLPPKGSKIEPIPPRQLVRIAIGNLGLPNDQQNGRVSDLLIARLSGAPGIQMVERQNLEAILKELNLGLSGVVRAGDAVRAGKMLRVDWFLLGTSTRAEGIELIVVRLVDARTGIFRDTIAVRADEGADKISEGLARFVGKCRADAAAAKSPVYLAIFAMDDLSPNNRLAALPDQLRGYLIAAYRGSPVTLLEREHVETLLQELRLDLAGLSEGGGSRVPVMQTAVWLVEADYQSYETVKSEVEVALRIRRIFGRSTSLPPVRQAMGEPLFRQIKTAIDQILSQPQPFPIMTRLSEVRAQISRGRELAAVEFGGRWGAGYQERTEQEARMQRRRLEEAIRAFDAVLLLEPTNREAEVSLAVCYCRDVIGRTEEGRDLFREVLESPVQDHWRDVAARQLVATFDWSDAAIRFNWFSRAEQETGNPNSQTLYHRVASSAKEEMLRLQGASSQPDALAEKKLWSDIRSGLSVLEGKSGIMNSAFGMDDYVYFFRPDKLEAGRKLAALLPHLVAAFPKLAPHLTAEALGHQAATNNPVLSEFERQLESCRAHPERVFALFDFWGRTKFAAYDWCMQYGKPDVAARIMEGAKQAARYTNSVLFDAGDDVALAFAYKAAGQWQQALAVFESYSNIPVEMSRGAGLWGEAFVPVLPSKEAAVCRQKLGLPVRCDSREFEMEADGLPMKGASAFAAEPDGLWVALSSQLIHLDFGLRTNLVQFLHIKPAIGITCVLVGSSNVWIGTDGDGLFEFNKRSRDVRRYGEQEGLMNDIIRSLCLAGDTLWIGYGVKNPPGGYIVERMQYGGLGEFALGTRQFRSFAPSLASGLAFEGSPTGPPPKGPPRQIVTSLACGRAGEVWFASSKLCRLRLQDNSWDTFPQAGKCGAVAANANFLVAGAFWNYQGLPQHGRPGISILNFTDNHWSQLEDFGVLPSGVVTTLAFDGAALWVGGMGFVAKINPQKNDLQKYAYVRAYNIEQIQVGGGYVWAQYDGQLHRGRVP